MSKKISLEYIDNYNLKNVQQTLESVFLKLNVEESLKNVRKVLIKVCIPEDTLPDMAVSTHPAVVAALVKILTNYGKACVVAESPYKKYTNTNLDKVFLNTGMLEVANLTTCELNRNLKTSKFNLPSGVMAKSIEMLDVINEVDAIINVGKLKITPRFGLEAATTNLFGFVPGEMKNVVINRLNTIKDYNNYILDIYEVLKNKIALNIVDGVVALEGGTTPRLMSCLGVAENSFALDFAMANILGVDVNKTIIKQAEQRKLFNREQSFKNVGEAEEKFTVQDFAMVEFGENTPLHTNKNSQKSQFMKLQKRVKIERDVCKGCGICTKMCPTNALTMKYDKNGELYTSVDYNKCIFCYKCVTACPYSVVEIVKPSGYRKIRKQIDRKNQI